MHFAIDTREAQAFQKTGKGQWSAGFLQELAQRNHKITPYAGDRSGVRWHVSTARSLLQQRDIDMYISPTSFIVPTLVRSRIRVVPVIHDLIAFRNEPHDSKATLIEKLFLRSTLKHARHICTVSETTKEDLVHKFPFLTPAGITTIYAGPMHDVSPSTTPREDTIVCIGTLCPRKNQLGLIQAYRSLPEGLRERYTLILAGGRGWHDSEIVRLATESPNVQLRGHVSEAEYCHLIDHCTIFAFPSLYEGFGMSVLDAMQHGAPVLTSNKGSLKEVAGDAAYIVDPEDITSIADGLSTLLSKPSLRSELSKKGPKQAATFSWKRTVDLFLEAMERSL